MVESWWQHVQPQQALPMPAGRCEGERIWRCCQAGELALA
jgi:hypothetical protein